MVIRLAKLSHRFYLLTVVYKIRGLLVSVGHKTTIHKITPGTGKVTLVLRGDIEMTSDGLCCLTKKTQEPKQDRPLLPWSLILDFTMTHVRFGRSHVDPTGQLTHTRHSDGVPQPEVF